MTNELFATTVRVLYRKRGRIKYISHLDIVRCISRALKRSRLPVWHTLGFNPHIYVTFALPLALGYESEVESMDFRLVEELPMREVVDRLNTVLPEGLECYDAYPAERKPEEICWADYEIVQEFDATPAREAADRFADWCARETLPVVKKGKKGERTVDVKERFSVNTLEAEGNTARMTMRTAAGNSFNLNPTLLLDTFAGESGVRADWIQVVRTAVLDRDGNPFR